MEQGERTRGDRAKRDAREWLPWLLLGAAALVGCTTLYAYSFADEGDSLWIGLLLSRGQRLYRDFFSHHFPFQDYWGAAVIAAFGKSILAVRLSVWGFQIAAFGIAMGLSRFHLPLALAALVWSVVRHLFLANLLLYPSFAAAALLVVLAIVLAILMGRVRPDWRHSLAVGLFSTVAILSDPLSVYAVAIALAFLLLADRKSGIAAGLWAGAGLLAFVIALAASGSLHDFVRDAIVFNSDVLSRYLDVGPQRLAMLLDKVVTGLGIGEPRFMDWDPFKAISSSDFDFWAFSGLLFRLAVLVAAALLLVQKDYAAAGFLYLFSAAALLNRPWGFRAAGFVLVALLAASAVASGAWWKAGSRPVRGLRLAAGALVGVMVVWLGLRVAFHSYVQDPGNLSYERHFARHEVTAAEFQRLACGGQDVLLGFYPGPAYAHWFSELQPVAGYWLMYPWVAEVALDPVLETLAQDEVKAIVRVRAREVKGHDPQSYLRPLLDYLDQNYVPAGEGLYRSPALAAQCPP